MSGAAGHRVRPRFGNALARLVSARVWLAAAAAVAAAVALAWSLWPQPSAPPQARQYLRVTACLLTGPQGIAPGSPGAPAWSAMQTASLATHVMVSYLPDGGPAAAPVMLNTLIERQCGVIVSAGPPVSQVITAAKTHPRQRFLLIAPPGAAGQAVPGNAVIVPAAQAPERIGRALHVLAAG